jgi:hypothetical protein
MIDGIEDAVELMYVFSKAYRTLFSKPADTIDG